MKSAAHRTIKIFLRNTTFHGFKYLASPFWFDRICWLSCCIAGACSAAMLCLVLWGRFLQSPMMLTRQHLNAPPDPQLVIPLVAVCPSPYQTAQMITDNLSMKMDDTKWLPILFSNMLRGKLARDDHRVLLDQLLEAHNMTLSQALTRFMPPCTELMRRCRWRNKFVPCGQLFDIELSRWGACCVMQANKLVTVPASPVAPFDTSLKLDLTMDCYISKNFEAYCCEFFIKYRGDEWLGPWYLVSGYIYNAQLIFTSIRDPDKEKIVNGTCESTPKYSYNRCMVACREAKCGCSHPLHVPEDLVLQPPCSVLRMKCLGNYINTKTVACNCLPPCQRVIPYMAVDSIAIISTAPSLSPVYYKVNSNSSIVFHLEIKNRGSKTYDLIETESWLTLLSSLGGVFNMFLGMGLFSAFELLYFVIARWTISILRTENRHPK